VPVYRAYQEWLGRGPELQETWDRWEAGDRAGAVAAIPDSVAEDLFVTGSIDECRAKLRDYQHAGITTLALALYPLAGVDVRQAIRDLAPE
jgi:alkanesulfonate monooxygenase SsuD/methylene tetrahydromethanopterin reductase-like flavin-dependent oxidoreductase (luciferase family)